MLNKLKIQVINRKFIIVILIIRIIISIIIVIAASVYQVFMMGSMGSNFMYWIISFISHKSVLRKKLV